jgi:hypothetical protein
VSLRVTILRNVPFEADSTQGSIRVSLCWERLGVRDERQEIASTNAPPPRERRISNTVGRSYQRMREAKTSYIILCLPNRQNCRTEWYFNDRRSALRTLPVSRICRRLTLCKHGVFSLRASDHALPSWMLCRRDSAINTQRELTTFKQAWEPAASRRPDIWTICSYPWGHTIVTSWVSGLQRICGIAFTPKNPSRI